MLKNDDTARIDPEDEDASSIKSRIKRFVIGKMKLFPHISYLQILKGKPRKNPTAD
jgi:hypothetical protein